MRLPVVLLAALTLCACGSRSGILGEVAPAPNVPDTEAVDANVPVDATPAPGPDATLIEPADAGPVSAPDASRPPPTDAGSDAPAPGAACASIPNLFAYYPLDKDFLDYSGNHRDAYGSAALVSLGKMGGAAEFDGTSSFLGATGAGLLPPQLTLCAWVDVQTSTGLGQPVFSTGTVNQGDFFSISATGPSGGTCPFVPPSTPFIDHWGTPCYDILPGSAPPAAWHLVCYAYEYGGQLTFSVDGQVVPVGGSLYSAPTSSLYLGSAMIGGTTTNPSLLGLLDEVTVWSVALGMSDYEALWNAGKGCKVR